MVDRIGNMHGHGQGDIYFEEYSLNNNDYHGADADDGAAGQLSAPEQAGSAAGVDESWAGKGTVLASFKANTFTTLRWVSNGEYKFGSTQEAFKNGAQRSGDDIYAYTKIVGNDLDNVIEGFGRQNVVNSQGDVRYSYHHDDLIYGGGGDDIIFGYEGNDRLFGDEGNDMLYGGYGYDTLVGGDGDDWLFPGTLGQGQGAEMWGGGGSDNFVLGPPQSAPGETPDTVKDDWASLVNTGLEIGSIFSPKIELVNALGMIGRALSDAFGINEGSSNIAQLDTSMTKIKDFNPLEDRLVIPVKDTSDILIDDSTNPDVAFTIKTGDGRVIAHVSWADAEAIFGPGATKLDADIKAVFLEQIKASALFIDRDGASHYDDAGNRIDVDPGVLDDLGGSKFLLIGAIGNQAYYGNGDNNMVFGTNFDDFVSGYKWDTSGGGVFDPAGAGNDTLRGFDGNDALFGGGGDNFLFGGAGSDTAGYVHAEAGIVVDMADKYTDKNGTYFLVSNGFGGTDKVFDVENILGSEFDDFIKGDGGANVLESGGGNDTLVGGGGSDTYVLSGGSNEIRDYQGGEGIIVDRAAYGMAGGDTVEQRATSAGIELWFGNQLIATLDGASGELEVGYRDEEGAVHWASAPVGDMLEPGHGHLPELWMGGDIDTASEDGDNALHDYGAPVQPDTDRHQGADWAEAWL